MTIKDQRLVLFDEPKLQFGHGQTDPYSKDGLLLFGPPSEEGQPSSLRYGIVGTQKGIELFQEWRRAIQGVIPSVDSQKPHFQYWPGFSAVFGADWPQRPLAEYLIDENSLSRTIRLNDRHHAIYEAASLFEEKISRHCREEERQPDIWFVVIPDEVFHYGRPSISVPVPLREDAGFTLGLQGAIRYLKQGQDLFDDFGNEARIYQFDLDFHAQLKARLLSKAVVQVVRESTLSAGEYIERGIIKSRRMQDKATTAWNLCTTAFFKGQGIPWRLANVRKGVCYIGIVYKIDQTAHERDNVCCGAQMFLDSGDGVVFRGAMGPWLSSDEKEFHLSYDAALDLMGTVMESYIKKHGKPPEEVFIHAKTSFNDAEWKGFKDGAKNDARINAVAIRKSNRLKAYRSGKMPLVRGTAWIVDEKTAFLWTSGYVPRLSTYQGWEVPNPLEIKRERGSANIRTIVQDVLGLTKLNYNACIFGDSRPVTLRFADMVGNILTATPEKDQPPLPFRFYI